MADQNQMAVDSSPIDPALLAWAEYWYPIAWKGLLVAGLITAIGACAGIAFLLLQWRTSSIREQQSDWRTSVLEFQAKRADADLAQAKADITTADAQAAEANARALEAQVALEKFRAPRTLSSEQQADVTARMSQWATIPASGLPQSAAVFSIGSSFEGAVLADQIAAALGPGGAKWTINRYPVMYGMFISVSGVGMLTSRSPRGIEVAGELAKALIANGIDAFVIPAKRTGCEDIESLKDRVDTDPACSAISVIVGDHPR